MNKWLTVAFAAGVLWAAGCSNRLPADDTGTKTPDIKLDVSGKLSSKWAISAGGSLPDSGQSIAVDSSGNSYVIGSFSATATFGSTTLTSTGLTDIFVVKVDGTGKFVWAISAGGISDDYGFSIAADGFGNSYVTGYFEGTASFGSTILTSIGSHDAFVAKLDNGGKFIWAVSAGGPLNDHGASIAIGGSGSYITGNFSATATFGTTTLNSNGGTDIFVAKLDGEGKFVWAVSAGGTSYDIGISITVDGSENSYLTGIFKGTATFGTTTLTSMGGGDIFVSKINSSGKFAVVVSAGGTSEDYGSSIAVDGSGSSYVTGYFQDSATFGTTILTSKGKLEIFVAKMDSSGNFSSVVSAGGTSIDYGSSIAVDGSGNSFITGSFTATATFGSTTLTSKGASDVFVARMDSSGNFSSVASAGGVSHDYGSSIAVGGSSPPV